MQQYLVEDIDALFDCTVSRSGSDPAAGNAAHLNFAGGGHQASFEGSHRARVLHERL